MQRSMVGWTVLWGFSKGEISEGFVGQRSEFIKDSIAIPLQLYTYFKSSLLACQDFNHLASSPCPFYSHPLGLCLL